MPPGFSASRASAMLTPLDNTFVQLHTGEPGANGTSNIAGNNTRKQVSFGAPVAGVMLNDAPVAYTTSEVDTGEDYTHFSLWTLVAGGTFEGAGVLTNNPVQVGDTYTLPVGSLALSVNVSTGP